MHYQDRKGAVTMLSLISKKIKYVDYYSEQRYHRAQMMVIQGKNNGF